MSGDADSQATGLVGVLARSRELGFLGPGPLAEQIGHSRAFGELVRRHRDRLWAVALRTLGDREEAADALQDALLSAFRGAHTFRGQSAVTTWLHRITVNACLDRVRKTAPALVAYTEGVLYGDLWERPGLSKRDRSLITVAALVASYRPEQLETHIGRALDNGVTREEIAELVTHLAFYAGWPAGMTGASVATTVFEKRND